VRGGFDGAKGSIESAQSAIPSVAWLRFVGCAAVVGVVGGRVAITWLCIAVIGLLSAGVRWLVAVGRWWRAGAVVAGRISIVIARIWITTVAIGRSVGIITLRKEKQRQQPEATHAVLPWSGG
jgi:hypothetical protein